MKTIVFTGDSHTCGQGATGFEMIDEAIVFDATGKGVGRNICFEGTCYVNLVRNYILKNTKSTAEELRYDALAQMYELPLVNKSIHLTRAIDIQNAGELNLIKFAEKKEKAVVEIYANDDLIRTEELYAEKTRYGEWSYRYISVPCQQGGTVRVVPVEGSVYISSLEKCSGEYAVINSGVGSCPSARYAKDYFDDCVKEFSPYMVIAEAHTINDWLSAINPEQYKQNLKHLLNKMQVICTHVVMVTVSPIMGSQNLPFNQTDYAEFIRASRETAVDAGIMIVDANKEMVFRLEGLDEKEQTTLMFHDDWHVNDLGHQIYAENIINSIKNIL